MSTTKRPTTTQSKGQQQDARSDADHVPSPVDENVHSLDKVRDILFGQNMRTYEERLVLLEQRMMEEVAELRKRTDASVERLEGTVRDELSKLGDSLKAETIAREAAAANAMSELERTAEALRGQIGDVDGRLKESGDGLAHRIHDESQALTSRLDETARDLVERLDREVRDVRAAKPDTASLAALFAELAERLREDSPGASD